MIETGNRETLGANDAPKPRRIEWIDELRGLAAVVVALFHGLIVLWVGVNALPHGGGLRTTVDRVLGVVSIPVHYGYAGVMLFFLLSGFVIHLPYANGARPFAFAPYLVRRVLRIYPPYVFAIVASLMVAAFAPAGYRFHLALTNYNATEVVKALLFAQNYPHAGGAMTELAGSQPASNLSLWSLPVEMELYIAYPLLLLALRRWSIARVSVGVALVSVAAMFVEVLVAAPDGAPANWANYLPTFLHFWVVWAAGAWLAERAAHDRLPRWNARYGWVFAIVLVAALLARKPLALWHDAEDYLWGAVCFLGFLRLAEWPAVITNRFTRPLAKLGTISYSLYLIHIPTFIVIASFWARSHTTLPTNYLFSVGAVALVIPIAAVMYRLIEAPSIAVGRKLAADVAGSRVPSS